MQKALSDLTVVARIYSRWVFRDPWLYVSIALINPLGMIVAIGLFAPPQARPQVLNGTLMLSILFAGMAGLGQDIASDRFNKRLSLFVTAPVSPLVYMLGVAMGNGLIVMGTLAILILVGWGILDINLSYLALAAPTLLLAWLQALSMGFAIGMLSKNLMAVGAVTNVVSLLLIFFAPVYYLPDVLPTWLRYLAYLVPTTHIAQALRAAQSGDLHSVAISSGVTMLFAMLFLALPLGRVRWRER